jgi:hypothetical protein
LVAFAAVLEGVGLLVLEAGFVLSDLCLSPLSLSHRERESDGRRWEKERC